MRLLLDTHVFLWWLEDDPRLSHQAREAIAHEDNLVAVSAGGWTLVTRDPQFSAHDVDVLGA